MSNLCVVGAQWGDEGKGKVIHFLSREAEYICRYQGGNNAGHTVVMGADKFVLHLVPSGIIYPGKKCIIGNGVVINPQALLDEIKYLGGKGVNVSGRLFISDMAHLIFPYHSMLDEAKEKRKGKIGTTKKGIGPAYMDKVDRVGIRVCDLMDKDIFAHKLKDTLAMRNALLEKVYQRPGLKYKDLYLKYCDYAEQLRPYVTNTSIMVNEVMKKNKKVLLEGAQGVLLDVDFGTYPYVTSSNPSAGGACVGLGIGPNKIDKILGIIKAYVTRVGDGPFPTRLSSSLEEKIREKGAEYGATTKRPRRVGWFDAVMVKHSVRVSGIDSLAVMKLDVLDDLDKIKICTGYKYKNKIINEYPSQTVILEECKPCYEVWEGWKTSTVKMKKYQDLPSKAKKYLSRIKQLAGVPLSLISVGADKDATILLNKNFFK